MKNHLVERRAVIFFANNFSASFRPKETEIFKCFWGRFDIPHCPLRFLNLTLFFHKRVCLLPSWTGNVVIDLGRIFQLPNFFRRQFFGEEKTQIFWASLCYFAAIIWPNVPCIECQWWLGDLIGRVSCIQFLIDCFLNFHNFDWKFFCKKLDFEIIFCNI